MKSWLDYWLDGIHLIADQTGYRIGGGGGGVMRGFCQLITEGRVCPNI